MNYYEKIDKDINISKIDNNLTGEFNLCKLKDFFSDSNNYITNTEDSRDYSNNNLEYSIGLKFIFAGTIDLTFNDYLEDTKFIGNISLLIKSSGGN